MTIDTKLCCNCIHCARWKTSKGVECHCDLTDRYLSYLDVMDTDNNCCRWEKETKWDLQREHDKQVYNKAIDDFVSNVKEHHYLLSDRVNSVDYGIFTIGLEQIAEQLKAGE